MSKLEFQVVKRISVIMFKYVAVTKRNCSSAATAGMKVTPDQQVSPLFLVRFAPVYCRGMLPRSLNRFVNELSHFTGRSLVEYFRQCGVVDKLVRETG